MRSDGRPTPPWVPRSRRVPEPPTGGGLARISGWYRPELGYILFAPYTNDKLVVRPFNVKEAVQDAEMPCLSLPCPRRGLRRGQHGNTK